jgi:DNA ligase-1
VLPMLAGSAPDVGEALARTGPAAVEWKLDGLRIQVHRAGDEVAVFTRSLDDWTARMPGVVAASLQLPVRAAVLDGEALALREDGRPHRFQDSSRMPLQPFLFDILHLDGADLLDEPARERSRILASVTPPGMRVPRTEVGDDGAAGEAVLRDSLEFGHEGVMVKALEAPYAAGRRGTGWMKVKQAHTLDLVVLGVEWGSGRRQGLLSNLHLGARDPETGGFVMLGKTFKGMTDAMLAWQTEALLALETHREGHVVYVRPELVVEIAFDGVQTSTRYPGGMALRFARVKAYRPDKRAGEADTIDAVRAIHARV